MRFAICLIPALILLLSAAGCNCCYQSGYYDPNGLAYSPMVQAPTLKPVQRPVWLGGRNRKHDPKSCPLCNAHSSTPPHSASETVPVQPHEGGVLYGNGGVGHSHGPQGFHQHSPDQPVQLNGIVPTSHTESGETGVQHAGYRSRGCGCGNAGCRDQCKGRCGHTHGGHSEQTGHGGKNGHCGADRSRCAAPRPHKPNCSGGSNCGCGSPPTGCGCSGHLSPCGPCVTCDVIEGYPVSGGFVGGDCSTCGSGSTLGSVIPGTIMDGGIVSGGVIPGEVIGDGVIFDGSIVNGGTVSGDPYAVSKPCSNCGKDHSTTVPPVPETSEPEEGVPGQIKPGTLSPISPTAPAYDPSSGGAAEEPDRAGAADENSVPPAREPSAVNEPESLPGRSAPRQVIPETLSPAHPPAGTPRARMTPSSWRTTSPSTVSPIRNPDSDDFRAPVREETRSEPTTLMIPTIPDENDTRHVHWIPEG